MPVNFTDVVKPSDFFFERPFSNSPFQNSQKETVAQCIVIMSFENGDMWFPFTFDDYMRLSDHEVSPMEHWILDELVKESVLGRNGEAYFVTHRFIGRLCDFIKTR